MRGLRTSIVVESTLLLALGLLWSHEFLGMGLVVWAALVWESRRWLGRVRPWVVALWPFLLASSLAPILPWKLIRCSICATPIFVAEHMLNVIWWLTAVRLALVTGAEVHRRFSARLIRLWLSSPRASSRPIGDVSGETRVLTASLGIEGLWLARVAWHSTADAQYALGIGIWSVLVLWAAIRAPTVSSARLGWWSWLLAAVFTGFWPGVNLAGPCMTPFTKAMSALFPVLGWSTLRLGYVGLVGFLRRRDQPSFGSRQVRRLVGETLQAAIASKMPRI